MNALEVVLLLVFTTAATAAYSFGGWALMVAFVLAWSAFFAWRTRVLRRRSS